MSAHLHRVIQNKSTGKLLRGAQVALCAAGSDAPLAVPIFADDARTQQLSNPFTCQSGVVDVYLAQPVAVRLKVSYGSETDTIDFLSIYPRVEDLLSSIDSANGNIDHSGIGELRSAANSSGVTDTINAGSSYVPEACMVTVEAGVGPVFVTGKVSLTQSTAGNGTVSCGVLDFTSQTIVEVEHTPLPNVVGRNFTARVSCRIRPASVDRVLALLIGNNPDSGQTGSVTVLNAVQSPSRIRMELS